jgi:hypothetical protein
VGGREQPVRLAGLVVVAGRELGDHRRELLRERRPAFGAQAQLGVDRERGDLAAARQPPDLAHHPRRARSGSAAESRSRARGSAAAAPSAAGEIT